MPDAAANAGGRRQLPARVTVGWPDKSAPERHPRANRSTPSTPNRGPNVREPADARGPALSRLGVSMRVCVRDLVVGLLAAAVVLTPAPAAAAEKAEKTAKLVVGLRQEAAPVVALDRIDAVRTADLSDAIAVDVPAGEVAEAIRALRTDPNVAYVEPDHIATTAAVHPDDPGYATQWGIPMTRVDDAWAATRGVAGVTIAVVDTGVRRPPDLAGRLLPGYDFVERRRQRDRRQRPRHDDRRRDRRDRNNGLGVAGICWYCRILPVKVLGADGSGTTATSPRASSTPPTTAPTSSTVAGRPDDSRCCATRSLRARQGFAGRRGGRQRRRATEHYPAAIPTSSRSAPPPRPARVPVVQLRRGLGRHRRARLQPGPVA